MLHQTKSPTLTNTLFSGPWVVSERDGGNEKKKKKEGRMWFFCSFGLAVSKCAVSKNNNIQM
jgi:hypothetical protein